MTENQTEPKKFSEKLKDFFSTTQIKKFEAYARENRTETASYILLLIGFLISLFNPLLGSALIGALAGYYFYDDILDFFSELKDFRRIETIKLAILAVFAFLVFLAYPFFFIAVALTVAILQLIRLSNRRSR
jgi:cytochrome bd-type quinol oxidase subunit 1